MRTSVVPDESERCTGVIATSGSVTPGFVAAIASSVQFTISPAKIDASVSGSSRSPSTPVRW